MARIAQRDGARSDARSSHPGRKRLRGRPVRRNSNCVSHAPNGCESIGVGDAAEIERSITTFARVPHGGLIVTGSALSAVHRDLIVSLAARHKLPAVYFSRFFVRNGGLVSYGADLVDQRRRAASYVDRILKGELPADLPVQAPTKYELVINLKTAKALGLEVPPTLLVRADEVIE